MLEVYFIPIPQQHKFLGEHFPPIHKGRGKGNPTETFRNVPEPNSLQLYHHNFFYPDPYTIFLLRTLYIEIIW